MAKYFTLALWQSCGRWWVWNGSSDYNLSAHWALLPLYLMNPFIVKFLQKGESLCRFVTHRFEPVSAEPHAPSFLVIRVRAWLNIGWHRPLRGENVSTTGKAFEFVTFSTLALLIKSLHGSGQATTSSDKKHSSLFLAETWWHIIRESTFQRTS